jgi:RNA polymerase sigma-70 factor (ECF subfamily)
MAFECRAKLTSIGGLKNEKQEFGRFEKEFGLYLCLIYSTMRFIKTGTRSELSDQEMIAQFLTTGNDKVIDVLFDRYAHLVFGVCMKYLTDEDAAKDATLEIFTKLSVDLKKHPVSYFKSWLYQVARNHCLMQVRQQQGVLKKVEEYHRDETSRMEFEPFAHHPKIELENQLGQLEKAITQLKEEQRICVELFFLKEKSYQEVVELTGYSLLNVKSHLQNGKRNLRILLTGKA